MVNKINYPLLIKFWLLCFFKKLFLTPITLSITPHADHYAVKVYFTFLSGYSFLSTRKELFSQKGKQAKTSQKISWRKRRHSLQRKLRHKRLLQRRVRQRRAVRSWQRPRQLTSKRFRSRPLSFRSFKSRFEAAPLKHKKSTDLQNFIPNKQLFRLSNTGFIRQPPKEKTIPHVLSATVNKRVTCSNQAKLLTLPFKALLSPYVRSSSRNKVESTRLRPTAIFRPTIYKTPALRPRPRKRRLVRHTFRLKLCLLQLRLQQELAKLFYNRVRISCYTPIKLLTPQDLLRVKYLYVFTKSKYKNPTKTRFRVNFESLVFNLHLAIIFRRPSVLIALLIRILSSIKKHRPFLSFLKRVLKEALKYYPELAGIQLLVTGKINGVKRTKQFFMRSGTLQQSPTASNVYYAFGSSLTFTGVFGLKLWLSY